MKSFRHILILFWLSLVVVERIPAQMNLVINPGFEDTIEFVPGPYCLQYMIPPWRCWQIDPDYLSKIYSLSSVYTNDTTFPFGSLIPHSGYGFIGSITVDKTSFGNQEYFSGKLSSPLKVAKQYCVEYYLKRSTSIHGAESFASDGFGIYFTKDSIVSNGCCTPPYTPQVKNPDGNVIKDTSWIAMSGSFIAGGGERYFIVGNFKDADQTTFDPPSTFASTYYFFDDFSVWYCDTTTVSQIDLDSLILYDPHTDTTQIIYPTFPIRPRPSPPLIIPNLLSPYENSVWQIINLKPETEVNLYNAIGQLIYQTTNYSNDLNANSLAAGMYFYSIKPKKSGPITGKLVVVR